MTASSGSNLVTVTLEQFLSLLNGIVDDSSVWRSVENLGSAISCQVVHTLVDIFIEADDPLQVLSEN